MDKKTKKIRAEYAQARAMLDELSSIKSELNCAYQSFDNAVDPDLIDACIYEINALNTRYSSALQRLKSDFAF